MCLVHMQDPNGNWTALDYQQGNAARLWDSSGRAVSFRYRAGYLAEMIIERRGMTQVCRYDHEGLSFRLVLKTRMVTQRSSPT